MGELYKVGGTGMGGASSDDCTALASQVLTGVTAVTKDSNDEPIQGTMPSQNQMTFANDCWWNASSGLGARMSPAYAAASSGSNPYVYVPPTNVRNTLGITAANIRSGVSIAGVTGTLVDYGASRTVFNNGTFDGVYVTGMSQNWETYKETCSLLANGFSLTSAKNTLGGDVTNKTKMYLVGTFNYALDMTPFKSVTVTVKNYGNANFRYSTSLTSSTVITCYVLNTSGKKIGEVTATVGTTTYPAGGQTTITRQYSATLDMSSYNGVYGLVFATGETGAFEYFAGFALSLISVTFNA